MRMRVPPGWAAPGWADPGGAETTALTDARVDAVAGAGVGVGVEDVTVTLSEV